MKRIRKWLCAVMAAVMMAMGCSALADPAKISSLADGGITMEQIQELNDGKAVIHTHDGRITLIEGSCTGKAVTDMEEASRVVEAMRGMLQVDERSAFQPWRTLTDPTGNIYYVFQQMLGHTTVSGGAIKVITDRNGKMLGLSCSVEAELPEETPEVAVTVEKAEAVALEHAKAQNLGELTVMEGKTAMTILPVQLEIDVYAEEEDVRSRFVWVVYTNNPTGEGELSFPYRAHYVTMEGQYLYSMPTMAPGDAASEAGFESWYVFEGMEPAEYTGTIPLADGTEKEITVTLMRDRRTGMYYMGNIERGIVVGDCHAFLFDGYQTQLEASQTNENWDQTALISLYNFCKVWDYYAAIGWKGGDGLGTPILVLNNLCDEQRKPVDNACYMGYARGWQLFGVTPVNTYAKALDVIAHEYTHCVTHTTMTYNAYLNDVGAINEAMSDILGNLCEMAEEGTEDWRIGEDAGEAIRDMGNPHAYGQPAFTGDLYYKLPVNEASMINDEGGVHANSSLLNLIAYRLIHEGRMTMEEARAYWFAVDCAMVPGNDYAQLRDLLPWVMKIQGMERYGETLVRAMEDTRLGETWTQPETIAENRAIVELKLPDTEAMKDGNWGLAIYSVNPGAIFDLIEKILLPDLIALLGEEEGQTTETLPEESGKIDDRTEEILEFVRELIFGDISAAGMDGLTITMPCTPGRTFPMLIHLESADGLNIDLNRLAALVWLKDSWVDVTPLIQAAMAMAGEGSWDNVDPGDLIKLGIKLAEIFSEADSFRKGLNMAAWTIEGGKVNELSAEGLEKVALREKEER